MISIIVPVYNRENKVGSCIASILNQTYTDLELILVDDGSTDNSVAVCEEYAKQDKRIRIIQKENGGVSSARNCGIKEARGEYVQFVDSDDTIDKEMTQKLYETIQKTCADEVICGFFEIHSKAMENVIRIPQKECVTAVSNMEIEVEHLIQNCLIQSCWNKLYRKEKIKEFFSEDYSYGEDLLFNLAYLKNIETVAFIPKAYYEYDCRGESITSSYRKDEIEIRIHLMQEVLAFSEAYLEGTQVVREFADKTMRAVIYSLFDIYQDERLSKQKRKQKILGYLKNQTVQKASRVCQLGNRQQRFCNLLIQKQQGGFLLFLFALKEKLHLY